MELPRLLRVAARQKDNPDPEVQKALKAFEEDTATLQLTLCDAFRLYLDGQDDLRYQRRRLGQLPPAILHLLDAMLTETRSGFIHRDVRNLGHQGSLEETLVQLNEGKPPLLEEARTLAHDALQQIAQGRSPQAGVAHIL